MDLGHPHLHPFDPDSGSLPEIVAPGAVCSGVGGSVVTLIVAPDVTRSSWSPAAATAIARAWSEQGRRVVLFDLSLTAPVLHQFLGLPNAVGIVDLILRGASMSAVVQQAGTAGFQFVAVGAEVADPTEVTLSDAWSDFVDEIGHADATILFYVPADLPGVDALVARSVATLLLAGDPTEAEWVAQSFALDDVVGLVEATGDEPEPSTEVVVLPASPDVSSPPLTVLSPDESPPAVPTTPGESLPPGGGPPAKDEFGFSSRSGVQAVDEEQNLIVSEASVPEKSLLPWRPALIGTLVALGALVAWQAVYTGREPKGPSSEPPGRVLPVEQVAVPEETPAAAVSVSTAPEQGYSLALAAYETEAAAIQEARAMAQRRPDLLFIVAPVRVSGSAYHRLLAGPAEDAPGAERIRASLAETLRGDDGARWIVRETPLAFFLGGFESTEAAADRVSDVRAAGVGAYVLEVEGSQALSYRVYAGAYGSSEEAVVMEEILTAAFYVVPALEPRMGSYVR